MAGRVGSPIALVIGCTMVTAGSVNLCTSTILSTKITILNCHRRYGQPHGSKPLFPPSK